MDLPEEVKEQLSAFKGTLEALEDYINPFTDVTPKEMDAQMHLKLHGQRPEDHPIKQEMDRLEKYEKKVRKALAEEELASTRPAITLDIAAANRFIDHAIPDLSKEQKERLKQAGAAMKNKAGPPPPEGPVHRNKKQKGMKLSVEEEAAVLLEQAFAADEAAPVVAEAAPVAAEAAPVTAEAVTAEAGTSGQANAAPTAVQQTNKKNKKRKSDAHGTDSEAVAVAVPLEASSGATAGSEAVTPGMQQLTSTTTGQCSAKRKKKRQSEGRQGS